MVAKAQLRFIRVSPQRARLLIPLIKGRQVDTALQILKNINKKSNLFFIRLVTSAVANAKHKGFVESSDLYISRLLVNEGPALKRHRAASFGRAMLIRKRTSHLMVELDAYSMKGK